jgi:hypothetical protein
MIRQLSAAPPVPDAAPRTEFYVDPTERTQLKKCSALRDATIRVVVQFNRGRPGRSLGRPLA